MRLPFVGALWRHGEVKDADIAAGLMSLADRGVIAVEPAIISRASWFGLKEKESIALTLLPERATGRATEREMSEEPVAADVADEESVPADASDEDLHVSRKDSVALARNRADALEPLDAKLVRLIFTHAAIALAALGIFVSVFLGSWTAAAAALPCATVIALVARQMPRRTPEGAELFAQYRAIRNFLRDFSHLDEAPPASVAIWNRFLVLALVFGIAERVIEQMRVVVPEVVEDSAFRTTYYWMNIGGHGRSPVSALTSGFASASHVASGAMSSSSGGGGGFSGGRGGGGGGGGGGAG